MNSVGSDKNKSTNDGLVAALMAYIFWGIFPIYFKIIDAVPTTEVFAHRIIWSIPFGFFILIVSNQWSEIKRVFKTPNILKFLVLSSSLISINWYIYILAVQSGEILQASLGYYINPLLYVLVGILFLNERLRISQIIAIGIAAIGVLTLTFSSGKFPWISIVLATSFTLYGVIRKKVDIGAMPGLFIETLFILPFACLYMFYLFENNVLYFGVNNLNISLILILAGPFTIFPLFFFAYAAKRLKLTTIGMMQFLSPTMQFIIAFTYGERLTSAGIICFICIWLAIMLFIYDALKQDNMNEY